MPSPSVKKNPITHQTWCCTPTLRTCQSGPECLETTKKEQCLGNNSTTGTNSQYYIRQHMGDVIKEILDWRKFRMMPRHTKTKLPKFLQSKFYHNQFWMSNLPHGNVDRTTTFHQYFDPSGTLPDLKDPRPQWSLLSQLPLRLCNLEASSV